MPDYAELQAISNFSFLRGASHGAELVARAIDLGLGALGLADRNTLAGVVRAHLAARDTGLKFIPGARLDLTDGPSLIAYPTDRKAYGRLSQLLTLGKRRAEKGDCLIGLADLEEYLTGHRLIAVPPDKPDAAFLKQLKTLPRPTGSTLYLAAHHLYRGNDRARINQLAEMAHTAATPLVATNDVHYHAPARRPLQDILTCIREKCRISDAGHRLHANAERHLKSPAEMHRLFAGHEDAVARTMEIADACTFSLDELAYEYPDEPVPAGKTPQEHLTDLAWAGADWRYPQGVPARVARNIARELALVEKLGYAPYFLTVHDIVQHARSLDILCQGRGSAANSAVCYCIGITSVDPARIDLLFERFVSEARKEPPDIDVDFEHERREEVIQYIYARYGRHRTGLTATVVSYRARSAVREVGKAMGLSEDVTSALAGTIWGSWGSGVKDEQVETEAGLDLNDPLLARTIRLTEQLIGFPRHLSQHVGGFVLTRGPLEETVPIGNAAMEDRTFIEWDKDDIDALGILKVDVLGLGMLTCIRKCFDLIHQHRLPVPPSPHTTSSPPSGSLSSPPSGSLSSLPPGLTREPAPDAIRGSRAKNTLPFRERSPDQVRGKRTLQNSAKPADTIPPKLTLATVPPEDPAVYDMLCKADAIGVFQVESRAQMNMLPRLKPRKFYDLVIEVAIVRPGPIQGDMVHPYLRRRDGIETVEYPSPAPEHGPEDELRRVLEKTLGVPLFQEQAMRIAIEAARFSPDEANALRRAMATFRRLGTIGTLEEKMVRRMIGRGYDEDFARRCFNQIKGFGEYGFPESHAASFALLVYVSAWLKKHYPEVFCAGLLNAQPMGFYAPAQIVRDARDHSIEVRPVDVNFSDWDNLLEPGLPLPPRGRGLGTVYQKSASAPDFTHTFTPLPSPPSGSPSSLPPGSLFSPPSGLTRGSSAAGSEAHRQRSSGQARGKQRDKARRNQDDKEDRTPLLVRLGFRQISGLAEDHAKTIMDARGNEPFTSVAEMHERTQLGKAVLERLAAADAFRSMGLDRRQALWMVRALKDAPDLPLFTRAEAPAEGDEPDTRLPQMPLSEHVVADYQTLRLSLKAHPLSFLRTRYARRGLVTAGDVLKSKDGDRLAIAGVVLIRQRPGSAKGVVFMTIEDETGVTNAVIWPKVLEKFRPIVMSARLVMIRGRIQRSEDVIHLVAHRLEDLTGDLARLSEDTLDPALARADEVKNPIPDNRSSGRRHPRDMRIIPKSRDFH